LGSSGFRLSRHYPVGSHPKAFANGSSPGTVIVNACHGAAFLCWKFNFQAGISSSWPAVAAESAIMNQDEIILGTREAWGHQESFGLKVADLRHHVFVIGKTGVGKTTLLKNILVQLITMGHGVGFIDPHGDLAEALLQCIPSWRADHVVYFNPSDLEFPIALNLLANVPKDDRHLVASGIVGAFKSLWRDSWGPRMEYILYNSVAALLDCQNVSLLGVNRILTDDKYRAWVLRQVQDPFVKEFWQQEYARYDERFRREAIAPIQNKLGQFLLNPVIRNILGQVKSKITFPFTIDQGRIFLANLAKGKIGHEKANLLGSLCVSQFQCAAMRRAIQPEAERRDFVLVIDEFQNFTTDAFASLLAEARKYHLCLVLSHQYIDQLSLPIRQAVFGNVGTLISFRVGSTDAEVLHNEFGRTHIAQQFVDLDRYEVIARLLENGKNSEPFKGITLPPIDGAIGEPGKLIASSRRKFALSRRDVEHRLRSFSTISSDDISPQTQRSRRSASPSTSPRSTGGWEAKKTKRRRGVALPI
jgi:hypothetical protein